MKKALIPLSAALVIGGLVLGGAHASRHASSAPPRVTSSIDGASVLPIKSRWRAYVNVPPSEVERVEFLIDGKVRCIEAVDTPYNYGSDDQQGHYGWLVTTWLAPGKHRFAVRARLAHGKTVSHEVVARVRPTPAPPAGLAGKWRRTVTAEDVTRVDPKNTSQLPTGTWNLVFDRVGVWELDPRGSGVVEHATYSGRTISIEAGLWMTHYFGDRGTPPINRYGHRGIGPGWREDGPRARYRWTVTGDRLTLTTITETTGPDLVRRAVWEGVWTRTR